MSVKKIKTITILVNNIKKIADPECLGFFCYLSILPISIKRNREKFRDNFMQHFEISEKKFNRVFKKLMKYGRDK